MLHPSYTDLINAVNSEVEPGEQPVVQSRYSIVLATSKRARQIIGGDEPLIARAAGKKPLSIAVQELYEGKVKILGDNDAEEAEEAKAIELCQKIQLKAKDISAPPSSLSGGNQQKVVFAKLLNCDLKVLILDEPTKGIDVGAKYSIYEIMNELTANGYAIIMVSSEMPEVLGMADRIVVMRNGRVAGQFDTEGTTQEMILEASLKQEDGRESES